MSLSANRYFIVALIIVIAAICFQTCVKKQAQVNTQQKVIEYQHDTIKLYRDKAGSEHAQRRMTEADLSMLKATYQAQIDSLSNRLGIKEKQLQSVTSIGTKTEGRIKPDIDTIVKADSTTDFHFHYADKWLKLDGWLGSSTHIDYEMQDSLIASVFFKKKNWFAKRQMFLDAFSMNPNVKTTGLTGYKVPYKEPGRWGIGPYVGLSYLNKRIQPSFGASLHYSFVRF